MKNVQKKLTNADVPAPGLVVAVVGSRSVKRCPALLTRLGQLEATGQLAEVVTGGAEGADELAAHWTQRAQGGYNARLRLTQHLPDYATHGAGAPLLRNALVVERANLVLVVWDGRSRGTLDAARKAARLGKPLEWLHHPAPDAAPVPGGLGL